MRLKSYILLLPLSLACCKCGPLSGEPTSLSIKNGTTKSTTVYVAFGSDSEVGVADWIFCEKSGALTCSFDIDANWTMAMPITSSYTNATISFANPVGCGVTKAEVNINNPDWYDILDVSLVDGFSNKIEIVADSTSGSTQLGPATDKPSDAQLMGVFPFGCDICVERQDPPCGIAKGKTGCKAGTQYNPEPPCQWQGAKKGGGDLAVTVELVE
jgi:hypothetical protein